MEFRDLTARAGLWYENFMKNAGEDPSLTAVQRRIDF
jgi:hypothetical protein